MEDKDFQATVEKIVNEDPRYAPDAYPFISEAVFYTTDKLSTEEPDKRHISGQELLEGIREFALNRFGPMAETVLNSWGINDSMDIGRIVFHMVDNDLLGSNENDSIDDFRNGYDFKEAFATPFVSGKTDNDIPVIDL